MHVHPPASRLKFSDDGSLLTIEIPSKRNWLLILFLGCWLCGWLVGELMATAQILSGKGARPAMLFLIAWLGFWTIGGAVAIVIFAWNIAGRELVSLSAQRVSVRREVWKVGVMRTYDIEHVSHLRVDGAGINIFDPRAAFAFWGLGGGRVAFDYGSSTVRFGYRIDDPEARHIIESFVRRRPVISESSRG